MEGYAEVQAYIDNLLLNGQQAPPPLTDVTLDTLKQLAQQAADGQHWDLCLSYLQELMAREYEPARTASNIGRLFAECGRIDEGLPWYRKSLELDPTQRDLHDALIFMMESEVETTVEDQLRERTRYFQHFCAAAYQNRTTPRNRPDPDRPLKIGYVGGDWNFHSASMAFTQVIADHHDGYVATAYSTLPPEHRDWVTGQWKQRLGDRYVEAYSLTPGQLAAVIKHDEIDILVDLAGYSSKHRLETFAYRPAPIQIQAWGFVVGTGSPIMDVLFADPIVAPPEVQAQFSERIYPLPCLLGYTPRDVFEAPSPLPCLEQPVTFGVFQRAIKINDDTLRVWRRVLEAVPDSQIMFKGGDYTSARRMKIAKALAGMESRIIFGPATMHAPHLNYYQQIDLSLDPWPQTGGISSMESLSMGVPMVTLVTPGCRMVQRTSASILTNVGFEDCITTTEDDYVATAVRLVTTDRARLAEMRATAWERLKASPICVGYVEAVETGYRTLWREWCARRLSYQTIH